MVAFDESFALLRLQQRRVNACGTDSPLSSALVLAGAFVAFGSPAALAQRLRKGGFVEHCYADGEELGGPAANRPRAVNLGLKPARRSILWSSIASAAMAFALFGTAGAHGESPENGERPGPAQRFSRGEHSRLAVAAANQCATRAAKAEFAAALEQCTYALRFDPNNVLALSNRGAVHMYSGDPKSALADFERAISLSPGDPALLFNRGVAHGKLGNAESAILDYSEALRLLPHFPMALHNRAHERERIGDRAGAIADYESALRLDPNLPHSSSALKRLRGDT